MCEGNFVIIGVLMIAGQELGTKTRMVTTVEKSHPGELQCCNS
jgi:hypothetical protein